MRRTGSEEDSIRHRALRCFADQRALDSYHDPTFTRKACMTDGSTGWFDNSLRALVASNLITLIIAIVEDWSLAPLLFIYWGQSVVIGGFHIKRILNLEEFTTAGLKMNGRPVDATPKSKRQIAAFFAMHYGFFHLVYFVFVITVMNTDGDVEARAWWALVGGVVVFAINHFFSYVQNRDLDERGKPNIGTMLFLPYARILPMHLLIVMGAAFGGGSRTALASFIFLKTIADAIMHVVEHRALRKGISA